MDVANPLRSIAPTVEADVLGVLVGTHAPLTGLRVQQLTGRSYARVRDVLRRLADSGVVHAERRGNAVSYWLNRDHILATAVEGAVGADGELERRIRALLDTWDPAPAAVVLFGSFARRDGDAQSDIDVMLVRPRDVGVDQQRWSEQRYDLARSIERWAGNAAQIVEMTDAELDRAIADGDRLIVTIQREGRPLLRGNISSL
jgi:predicted nucleotidyltransferase